VKPYGGERNVAFWLDEPQQDYYKRAWRGAERSRVRDRLVELEKLANSGKPEHFAERSAHRLTN